MRPLQRRRTAIVSTSSCERPPSQPLPTGSNLLQFEKYNFLYSCQFKLSMAPLPLSGWDSGLGLGNGFGYDSRVDLAKLDRLDSSFPNQNEGQSCSSESDQGRPGEYWRWCPRCSQELANHKCKLVCRRCGYFMSCSDFD